MKRRKQKTGNWAKWCVAASLAAVLALPSQAAADSTAPMKQLNEVFERIEQLHVDRPTGERLRDAAIQGMLDELNDPYTDYYDAEMWYALQNAFEQVVVGIGIQFAQTDEGLQILRVYRDSAADEAGMTIGDVIVGVAGKTVKGHTLEELTDVLLGAEGSKVKLDLVRASSREKQSVTITRRPFHIPSVEFGRMDGGAGYIRLDSFSRDTPELVGKALDMVTSEPALTSLMIDLRGNPGGYLDAVLDVAGWFIEEGAILHTIDRDGKRVAVTIEGGSSVGVPVVLLIDDQSASASEVFAGAMQDYGLAKLIGSRTYGKGSVQQLIPLATGGGLRVTVEHYLTPKLHEVNRVGITPDVEAASPLEQTLTAVREAGIKDIRIELSGYETIVNGIAFHHVVPVVRVEGRIYVSSLALASVVDDEAVWDGQARTITIQGLGQKAEFGESNGLLLKDGSSFVDAALFAKAFSGVKAITTTKKVVLELNGDG